MFINLPLTKKTGSQHKPVVSVYADKDCTELIANFYGEGAGHQAALFASSVFVVETIAAGGLDLHSCQIAAKRVLFHAERPDSPGIGISDPS